MANIFDPSAKISPLASIDVSSRGTDTVIGANSVVDDYVRIKHVGGTGSVVMGSRVYLNSGTVIYSGNGITMGDAVLIGPNCSLVPVNHEYRARDTFIIDQRFMESRGGIIIEDDVWIGAGCTICDGAIIRKGAVIGAGSVVRGEVEPYSVNVGNPLKKIGERK